MIVLRSEPHGSTHALPESGLNREGSWSARAMWVFHSRAPQSPFRAMEIRQLWGALTTAAEWVPHGFSHGPWVNGEILHGNMAKGSTTFPQPIALATTWDPEFVFKVFTAGALETRARGSEQVLGPNLDLARDA